MGADFSTPVAQADEQVTRVIQSGAAVALSNPIYYQLPGGILMVRAEQWNTTEHQFTRYTFTEVGDLANSWQTTSYDKARKLEQYLGI